MRGLFGLTPKSSAEKIPYPKTNDFKRYVVERAVTEISHKSDLYVIPKYIKKGRVLTHVEFQVTESKYNPNQLTLALNDKTSFEYKFLHKLSRLDYTKVDLDEVKKIMPLKYDELKEEVDQKVDESIHDFGDHYHVELFAADRLEEMKINHLKSEFIKYARATVSD